MALSDFARLSIFYDGDALIYVTSIQTKPLAKFTPTSGDLTGQIGLPRLLQLQLMYTLD